MHANGDVFSFNLYISYMDIIWVCCELIIFSYLTIALGEVYPDLESYWGNIKQQFIGCGLVSKKLK